VLKTVKEKADRLTSAATDTAKAVQDSVTQAAVAVSETAERAWTGTKQTAMQLGSEVSDRAQTVHADAVIFIRRNPLASVLGAVGVGLVLGFVLSGGSSRR
jgi:ElaB/YqjD/DUF883 family membrane-anchored ribosome-binding protein